jgi:hypothetical protein
MRGAQNRESESAGVEHLHGVVEKIIRIGDPLFRIGLNFSRPIHKINHSALLVLVLLYRCPLLV